MPVEHENYLKGVQLYEERLNVFKKAQEGTRKANVPENRALVEAAGRWLDLHPPAHVPDGPFGRDGFGFEQSAAAFYNLSSGIVHGLKWVTDWMPTGSPDLARVVLETLSSAVGMVECAVALFEAQAQNRACKTERPRLYPEVLQPTIDEWAALFSVTSA